MGFESLRHHCQRPVQLLGKPVGINQYIGYRPMIAAFGNSDGDHAMLQCTTINNPRLSVALIVHHTDRKREYAYSREAGLARLDKALDEAPQHGWTVVDMK